MQTANLLELQTQWLQLHDDLGGEFGRQKLAAPFISVPDEPGFEFGEKPILLVGKATAGGWHGDQFNSTKDRSLTQRLDERRKATLDHLVWRRTKDRKPSAFWRLRRGLEQISQPVIWTNLAKIGVERLNPSLRLIGRQSELAQQTLRAEIAEYKPALVVLVTGRYASEEIAHPVFGQRESWEKPDDSMWFKRATQTEPAMLWVDHPERKRKRKLNRWLEKAQELIS